jgi:hypothetical protein
VLRNPKAITHSALNLLLRLYNPGYFYRSRGLRERGAMHLTCLDFGAKIENEKTRKYGRYFQK